MLRLAGEGGTVVGVDVEIRPHTRKALDEHPLREAITLIEGSSTDPDTVARVSAEVTPGSSVMVVLDSNHTYGHVLEELNAYSGFVTSGQYLVVFDTLIEELPVELSDHRPWGPGNNPYTAVEAFLEAAGTEFEIDHNLSDRLLVSAAAGGYLRRI